MLQKILYNKLLRKQFYQLCELQPYDIRFTFYPQYYLIKE